MKKISYLAALMSLALVGCGQSATPSNSAPSVVGVKDVQCIVNSTVDFLDGVAALDKEDGDITPNMKIEITPHVEVVDGYATFTKTGEYTVSYQIEDSGGRVSQKRSYVDVVSREKYVTFDMPEGFSSATYGEAKFSTCGMVDGDFVVRASGHEVAEDVQIRRKFNLKTNIQYTFKYTIDARCEGKVKVLANGVDCSEGKLLKGKHVLSFQHIVLSEKPSEDVTLSLCFGGIAEDIDLTIVALEAEYPQEEGKVVDLTENFSFAGRVLSRIESGCEGNTWAENSGKTAVLEITKPIEQIWLGGMFINTGIELKPDVTYTVSCDMLRENENPYELIIQRGQWDEYIFEKLIDPADGHHSVDITPDSSTQGPLWLYVQSGNYENRIRMSNLKVEEHLAATGKDTYAIEDYAEWHDGAYSTQFSSRLGAFTYHIDEFAPNDSQEKVTSPSFFVAGSGGNYVLSFKAKATAPIEVVVAAPVKGGWDPTLMWNRITLSEQESAYTFFFNGSGSDRDYTVVWQFGSTNNQRYHGVTIDVSDVSICLRNRELDG